MTSEQKYNTMKIVFEALNKQVPQKPEKESKI